MRLYLVERAVRGWSRRDLDTAHLALEAASRRTLDSARYLRTIFVPGQERCLWLFRAVGPDRVRSLADAAQLPGGRVEEVVELEGVPMR